MSFLKRLAAVTAVGTSCAFPAIAGTWSEAEVDAAMASVDKSYVRVCADRAGGTFAQVADQRDLNRDGVNELIVYTWVEGASGCLGSVGQEVDLLISDGSGGWSRNLGYDTHGLNFFDRPDSDWPDIELSGPGFCFPIWRYHAGEYGIWKTCENGNLVFAEGIREGAVPAGIATIRTGNPEPRNATYTYISQSGQPSTTGVRSEPVTVVDMTGLEGGIPYLHNGSVMRVYPEHGLIVYEKPREGIAHLVQRGTILFEGRRWDRDQIEDTILRGRAFVFRKGCEAAGYDVRGIYHHTYGMAEFTLEGPAPVRRQNSCDIVGHDMHSASAKLRFETAWD